jgi:hypothetical protein
LFERNIVHRGGALGGSNGEGFYIGSAPSLPTDNTYNVIIRSNLVYDCASEGIEFKPGTHNCLAEGNTMYNCCTGEPFRTIEIDEVLNWNSDPNHVIRNNIVHDTKTPVRAGTGCSVYNNVFYNISSPYYVIRVDNLSGDPYTRRIYHNTMVVPSTRAVSLGGGTTDLRNNIGPSSANNMASTNAFYVDVPGLNFRLASGSAPIDAGVDLSSVVAFDLDGNSRLNGSPPDMGAYEFVGTRPSPPQNLRVVGGF